VVRFRWFINCKEKDSTLFYIIFLCRIPRMEKFECAPKEMKCDVIPEGALSVLVSGFDSTEGTWFLAGAGSSPPSFAFLPNREKNV
jgi:hypothetical protein